ncbi:MAG: transposase [Burkholderiaceae bacterium]
MKMVDTKKRTVQAGSVSGVRVNRTGRRTYTLQYKLDVVRQCSGPGVSVAGVALQHGINANLVRRWIVRHQRARIDSRAKPQTAILPVAIVATPSVLEARADDPVDASTTRKRSAAPIIEIELYGARIHLRGGVDAQALRSVLDVLAQR